MNTRNNSTTQSTLLIIGATSSLGRALCTILAKQHYNLILTGTNKSNLARLQADLTIRYSIHVQIEAMDFSSSDVKLVSFSEHYKYVDTIFILSGYLQENIYDDPDYIADSIAINFTRPAQIMAQFSSLFEQRGHGSIIVVSSVAGDRGRAKNYVYGSAKAGLTAFASGLRNRLAKKGVHILTVKPGTFDTSMTYGKSAAPLMVSRDFVASRIVKAWKKGKDVVYIPFPWFWIMKIIIMIPERIFKFLKI